MDFHVASVAALCPPRHAHGVRTPTRASTGTGGCSAHTRRGQVGNEQVAPTLAAAAVAVTGQAKRLAAQRGP